MSQQEGNALAATLDEVAPSAPTACAGWTAHDIVAHLAAGSKEIADLIEERLTGQPTRPTRGFEGRERPFRALPNDELRAVWSRQVQRKTEAQEALAALGEHTTFDFTGTAMTFSGIAMHSRSEAAVHRWDIAGSDDVSDRLLAQPELTAHAVSVLNAMPILNESPHVRAAQSGRFTLQIVLRSAGQPDVLLAVDPDRNAKFELVGEGSSEGDAIVSTDPAHRLLVLWGRRSATHPVTIEADHPTAKSMSSILWPAAIAWR